MENNFNHTKVERTTDLRGNGLYSTTDAISGDELIRIRSPLVAIPEAQVLEKVCYHCFAPAETSLSELKKCAGCMVVFYCSQSCQRASWRLIHKLECPMLSDVSKKQKDEPLVTAVRAIMQILLKNKDKIEKYSQDNSWQEVGLVCHETEIREKDPSRYDGLLLQCMAAKEFSKVEADLEPVVSLFARIEMNGIRIHQGDNTCLGLCFEPIVSMANHSCTPNAYISFIGRQLSLRALDPIKKGEEITISYIDPSYPLPIRQAELSRYYFTCTCDKCTSDWDTYATYLKCPKPSAANKKTTSLLTPPQTQKLLDHGTKFLRNPTNKPILAKATTLAEAPSATSLSSISQLTPLMNPIPLPIQPIPSLLDTLYLHHLDDYNFLRCLTIILCISFNIDPILYPQSTHPTRVYHLITAVHLMQRIIYLKPMEFVANPIPNRTTESLKIPSIKPAGGKIQTIHESMNYHQCAHALLILLDRLVDVSHGADSQWARNLRALLAEVKQGPNIKWEEREMDAGSERGEQVLKACFAELAELAGCIGEVVEATEGVA